MNTQNCELDDLCTDRSFLYAECMMLLNDFPELKSSTIFFDADVGNFSPHLYPPKSVTLIIPSTHPLSHRLLHLFRFQEIAAVVTGNHTVNKIVTKHLLGERDILLCQDELIDAGFAEWAKT